MLQQLFLGLVTLSLLFSPWQAPAAKSYSADRFDVDVVVQTDGSLQVTERLTLRFVGGPFTYVFRHLETDRTDGIDSIRASVDGVAFARGEQAGQIEIEGRDPIKITWHLPETSDMTHTFELTYRVLGVVRQESGADLLAWKALPDDHEYAIAASTVRVSYPTSAELVGAPEVWAGTATVERGISTVTFDARDLGPDESLTVALRFASGSVIAAPPQWQTQRDSVAQRGPIFAFVGLGGLILGVLVIVVAAIRHRRPRARDELVVTRPPTDVAPAIAGVLANRGSLDATWAYALATCFDLARRGVIVIEERPRTSWLQTRDFIFRLMPSHTGLQPHERGLINAFFRTKDGISPTVRLSALQRTLYQRLKSFSKLLKADCDALGIYDPARQRVRKNFLATGIMLLLVGSVFGIATALLFNTFGAWSFVIAGALILLAIIVLIVSTTLSPLTDVGHQHAQAWKAFSRYLWDVTRLRETLTHKDQFEGYLPYAAAFGLAQPWSNYLKKHEDVEVPQWFRGLATTADDGRGAFVAMMVASSSAGGSSGGASGAGAAAGGGASGAG